MNNQAALIAKFGHPVLNQDAFQKKWMTMMDLKDYEKTIPPLPSKLYCNKMMIEPLRAALDRVVTERLADEIITWDGCYNVRFMRNSQTAISRHSWGIAIDMNAAWNPLIRVPPGNLANMRQKYVKWSEPFLQAFRDNGFDCGADWKSALDGMHFELIIK